MAASQTLSREGCQAEHRAPLSPQPLELSVQDLRFRYRRSTEELFNGLTYSFPTAAVTAITGASGRGKSTLLYVLGLMLKPTAGEVCYGGVRADNLPDVERSRIRAQHLGFVFQDAVLDPNRTIADSIIEPALYGHARRRDLRARAQQLLEGLGVGTRLDHLPGQISGGQAQRVAIARALLTNPSVILADEPTGNLDAGNTAVVLDALTEVAQEGRTVIIATHDPDVLAIADHVLDL